MARVQRVLAAALTIGAIACERWAVRRALCADKRLPTSRGGCSRCLPGDRTHLSSAAGAILSSCRCAAAGVRAMHGPIRLRGSGGTHGVARDHEGRALLAVHALLMLACRGSDGPERRVRVRRTCVFIQHAARAICPAARSRRRMDLCSVPSSRSSSPRVRAAPVSMRYDSRGI